MNMCQKYGIIFGHINDMELPLWNSLVIAFGNITKKKLFEMGMCKNHWEHLERRKPLL
jgi:hypothetical protein